MKAKSFIFFPNGRNWNKNQRLVNIIIFAQEPLNAHMAKISLEQRSHQVLLCYSLNDLLTYQFAMEVDLLIVEGHLEHHQNFINESFLKDPRFPVLWLGHSRINGSNINRFAEQYLNSFYDPDELVLGAESIRSKFINYMSMKGIIIASEKSRNLIG